MRMRSSLVFGAALAAALAGGLAVSRGLAATGAPTPSAAAEASPPIYEIAFQ